MADRTYDYSFARRPAWIASHLFVLACVVLFVRLGFWQLDRLHGRREANALIEARMDAAPAPLDAVVPPGSSADDARDATFRPVTVTGTYRADQQVLVRNRTNQGAPGYWVLTPLETTPDRAVVVNRGWVPLPAGEAADASPYAPPTGTVTVTGLVRDSERREGLGVADPETGTLTVLSRVDVERLGQQVPEQLAAVWVQLTGQEPAQTGTLPLVIERPVLDDGPHLNYVGQWFIFATLTVIVYPLLLRRVARNKAAGGRSGDDGIDPAPAPAPVAAAGEPVGDVVASGSPSAAGAGADGSVPVPGR
ncbi:MAG: SURF1 family protein [Acidimicrobiales bacterium]